MLLYKDNRFHFNNISFCLPDNVYLNASCEEYDDCIELRPADSDFRIIIYGDCNKEGAKQFFSKGEEVCYRRINEIKTVKVGNLTGYSLSYNSVHNAYTEYRFDIASVENNVLGIVIQGKTATNKVPVVKYPAVVNLLNSLKAE